MERYWEDFCFAALKSIADRAKSDGNAAFTRVKASLKFPVVLSGAAGDLTLEDVAQLRRDAEQAAVIGGKKTDGAPAKGSITCDRFAGVVGQLQGAGALQAGEQEWLDRLREVLAGLPDSQPGKVHILTTTERQLQPGEAVLDGVFIDMAIVAGAQPPTAGVRIRNTNAQLGEFLMPDSSPLWFHFFVAGEGGNRLEQAASFSIEAPWSIVRLLEKYSAERSTTDKRVWYLKLPVAYKDARYSTWLKIELEKELPELKRWRELKPAP